MEPHAVEQRIGRIDRLGQKNAIIRIVNMHFWEHAESMELGSPGNPLSIAPESASSVEFDRAQVTLMDILDGG